MSHTNRAALLIVGAFLAASACSGTGTVPSNPSVVANTASQVSGIDSDAASPADNTSVLKKLTKAVVIGSTVDPKNGDTGARALTIVNANYVLKKGQLLVCNFDDSSNDVGKGTTIEVLDPKPGSKPATFAQSAKIEGCDGDAATSGDAVYATGMTSKLMAWFSNAGALKKTYGSPISMPFDSVNASPKGLYKPEYIFVGDAKTGSIISLSLGYYGTGKLLEVATGFAVNSAPGWDTLGPSGLQYNAKSDTLYIADGVDDTIVAFTHASSLLEKDEIIVKSGGKTFACKYPQTTCGKLIYSGKPLDAPEAMTLLANGNLIVANTHGNTLVELTPAGKILDTKFLDNGKTPTVFGLAASGTTDDNTVLFYTNSKSNQVKELEQ